MAYLNSLEAGRLREVKGVTPARLEAMVLRWENIARNKFVSAEHERNLMGRRLIEHGAMCYRNCAEELRAAITGDEPCQADQPESAPTQDAGR